jgi:regulator of sigma E protease
MLTLIAFVLVLAVVIVVHELGHFTLAKLLGAAVDRFSFGFGPRLVGKRIGETEYRISALPLGGYVKLLGERPDEPMPEYARGLPYHALSMWKRIAIVVAGPLFNMIAAFLILTFSLLAFGLPVLTPKVGEVEPGSPAAQAGLRAGDRIESIDGVPVARWEDLPSRLEDKAGSSVRMTVLRDDARVELSVTPKLGRAPTPLGEEVERPLIGVGPAGDVVVQDVGMGSAPALAARHTWNAVALTYAAVAGLLTGNVSLRNLAGPVAIAEMSGEATRAGPQVLLSFIALLSVNIAVLNLLPLPVLDGGRLVLLLIELVRRRPLKLETQLAIQSIGAALLLALTVFVLWNDLARLR